MAQNALLRLYLVGLFALLGPHLGWGQSSRLVSPPPASVQQANAQRILDWERSQLPVREHGYNRGKEVEAYQRTTGNAPGDEWCGSFQATANARYGLPIPAGAGGSYNWFLLTSPRTFFVQGVRGSVEAVEPGHRFGIYNPRKRRVGHIGAVEARTRNGFVTLEGNTGSGAKAGVHRLTRSKGEIYAASNWSY